MKRVFTKSDFKNICQACGRNCEEEESLASIPITFRWKYEGNTVFICGSFSGWQVKKRMHRESVNEPFTLELSLPPGTYEYKFIVDGVWRCDPYDSVAKDDCNGKSNVIEILPRRHHDDEEDVEGLEPVDLVSSFKGTPTSWKIMKIVYQFPAENVWIKGAWDGWTNSIPLKKDKNNYTGAVEFFEAIKIPSGNYHFKFLVDGNWTTSNKYPVVKDSSGAINNMLIVPAGSKQERHRYIDWIQKGTLPWKREEGKWTEELHHMFQGHSMSVVCDMIYIFGGIVSNNFTNAMYLFDPRTKELCLVDDQEGEIPEPRAFHSTSVFGTKILVYGGFNQAHLNDCYVFDTAINTWAKINIDLEGQPMCRERATLAPYADDKLVLFGGYYCSDDMEVERYLNDTHVLNLSLTKWIKADVTGPTPPPRSAHTANFIRSKMFVFGGLSTKQKNLNDVWVLKTRQSGAFEWKKIEPIGGSPEPRHGHSAVVAKDNIIYYGGKGDGTKEFYSDLFVLDTVAIRWIYPKVTGVMPTPRYYHASVALNKGSEIVIFGGIRPKEFLTNPRMYILEVETRKAEKEKVYDWSGIGSKQIKEIIHNRAIDVSSE